MIQMLPMHRGVGIDLHGAELEAEKARPQMADAFLAEQGGAGGNQFHPKAAINTPTGTQTGAAARTSVQSKTRFHDGTRLRAIRSETTSILSRARELLPIEFIRFSAMRSPGKSPSFILAPSGSAGSNA